MEAAIQSVLYASAARYIWWEPPAEAIRNPPRVIAQVMDIGDLEDVQALLDRVGVQSFRAALRDAQPGWFNARSWHFWHYRLGLTEPEGQVPAQPCRTFGPGQS